MNDHGNTQPRAMFRRFSWRRFVGPAVGGVLGILVGYAIGYTIVIVGRRACFVAGVSPAVVGGELVRLCILCGGVFGGLLAGVSLGRQVAAKEVEMNRIGKLLLPRFSLRRAVLLASLFGVLYPLVKLAWLYCPWWLFFGAFIAILALLYERTEKGAFRSDRASVYQSIGAMALFVLGIAGSAWCLEHHVCMAGHMEHGPYATLQYVADATWVLALFASALWLTLIRSPACIALASFGTFVVYYRFVLGSLGGMWRIPIYKGDYSARTSKAAGMTMQTGQR